jgi:hypothetical protein
MKNEAKTKWFIVPIFGVSQKVKKTLEQKRKQNKEKYYVGVSFWGLGVISSMRIVGNISNTVTSLTTLKTNVPSQSNLRFPFGNVPFVCFGRNPEAFSEKKQRERRRKNFNNFSCSRIR